MSAFDSYQKCPDGQQNGSNRYFRNVILAVLTAVFAGGTIGASSDSLVTSSGPALERTIASTDEIQDPGSRLPMLTHESQIPVPEGHGVWPSGYGTGGHPFTTKLAAITPSNRVPTNLFPYRSTGKLWMRFGASWFVCSASTLKPGVLVSAAHCVHDYGQGIDGWADEVYFEPARFGSGSGSYALPFGQWDAFDMFIPTVYFNGTDDCTVFGVVCANDIAIIVVEPNANGDYPGDVVQTYDFYRNSNPYTSFQGVNAAQITALGYPVNLESGRKMIRTDSLGYQATPNNVIIGSDMMGGSSGGPWIMNFGSNPSSTSAAPEWNHPRRVAAVTSWGYVSDTVKVQGASRFDTNSVFTTDANIDVLLDDACGVYPNAC